VPVVSICLVGNWWTNKVSGAVNQHGLALKMAIKMEIAVIVTDENSLLWFSKAA